MSPIGRILKMSICESKMPAIRTAALYIRVSTHEQEELSPDSQKRLLLDYANAHQISVPEQWIFQENGVSGRKADKRPQFQQMIAQAKSASHPFDAILVWKFSRFARNQEESIVYKSMLKNKYQVYVISISEPIIDGPFGSLIERIIEWMDEFYSIRLSGDVVRGMTEKALRGGCQCRPPLGYCLPFPKSPLQPVPEEAQIIGQIFHWYCSDHLSLASIARRLNDSGARTRQGNLFDKRSLSYILQNPVYTGKIRWNRTDGSSRTVRDPSQWIISQGTHPPIISEEIFQQAARRLASDKIPVPGSGVSQTFRSPGLPKHWLSGLLKCPACGQSLSACTRHRKTLPDTLYFQCTNYIKGQCSCNCYLPEAAITAAVLNTLQVMFPSDSRPTADCQETLRQADHSVRPPLPEHRGQLLRRRQQICQQIYRARSAYLAGTDTLEEYTQTKSSLRTALTQAEAALKALDSLPEKSLHRTPSDALCAFLASTSYTNVQKSAVLKRIVRKIVCHKAERCIDIYLHFSL